MRRWHCPYDWRDQRTSCYYKRLTTNTIGQMQKPACGGGNMEGTGLTRVGSPRDTVTARCQWGRQKAQDSLDVPFSSSLISCHCISLTQLCQNQLSRGLGKCNYLKYRQKKGRGWIWVQMTNGSHASLPILPSVHTHTHTHTHTHIHCGSLPLQVHRQLCLNFL